MIEDLTLCNNEKINQNQYFLFHGFISFCLARIDIFNTYKCQKFKVTLKAIKCKRIIKEDKTLPLSRPTQAKVR